MKRTKACRIFLLTCGICFGALAEATDLNVPDPYNQPQLAINAAGANDRVVINQAGPYQPFTLNKAIIVTKSDNLSVSDVSIVAGISDAYAVEITADGARVEGLTLIAGSNPTGIVNVSSKSEVKNCILQDNGYNPSNYAVYMTAGAKLRGCTVTMTNGDPAAVRVLSSNATYPDSVLDNTFYLTVTSVGSGETAINVGSGGYVVLSGNKILFTSQGGYVAEGIHAVSDYCRMANNTINGASKAIYNDGDHATIATNVLTGSTYGVYVVTSNYLDINHNTVVRPSCSASTYGIWVDGTPSMTYSIQNNLVENFATGFNFGRSVEGTWTINHNTFWSDSGGCGTGSNQSLTSTQLKTNLEPLFCAAHESPVGEYTQRIDSGTAPGNNGWGDLVGVFDVECAWGTLAINTTVPENVEALVLEDLTVPNNKTLALQPGATLKFDDDDNSGGGTFNNELIVTGMLTISGNSGNHAKLQSSLANAPDSVWAGIVFNNGASGTLSYGDVRDCTVGLTSLNAGAVNVSHCLFEHNKTLGMNLKRANGSNLVVQNNTINIGDGVGIAFESTAISGDHTISGNVFNLSSLSDKGLALSGNGPFKEIYDNSFSGGSSAYAIEVTGEGDWKLEHNSFTSCSVGIREERNSQQQDLTGTIGGSGVGDRNTITYCTTGISLDGSKVKPLIRYNDINQNSNGIVIRTEAFPSLGSTGLGSGRGCNTFLNNTSHCIYNQTTNTIYAMGNYFGDIPDCDTTWVPGCGSGIIDFGKPLCTDPGGTLVEMVGLSDLPLAIQGIFPNPIRSQGIIRFSIAKPANVTVKIYDLSGRVIRDLGASSLGGGNHYAVWDGKDDQRQDVGSGVYFARVTAGASLEKTAKLLVAR